MSDTPDYDRDQALEALFLANSYAEEDRTKRGIERAIESLLPGGYHGWDASALTVGDRVPDFDLPGAGEDGIELFSLSEFTDSGAVVLTFYPFDFSPVCTSQLCHLRDAEWLTFTEDVDVFGVSVDSAYSHHRFREEYDLQFPLLTDRLATVADRFGVRYDEWENHPAVCQRSVFAIDDTNTVRYRWHSDDANDEPTTDDLREAISWLT